MEKRPTWVVYYLLYWDTIRRGCDLATSVWIGLERSVHPGYSERGVDRCSAKEGGRHVFLRAECSFVKLHS